MNLLIAAGAFTGVLELLERPAVHLRVDDRAVFTVVETRGTVIGTVLGAPGERLDALVRHEPRDREPGDEVFLEDVERDCEILAGHNVLLV
jgi:hypothetical protein